MPDGEADSSSAVSNSIVTNSVTVTDHHVDKADDHGHERNSEHEYPDKDPRKIARQYQLELCKKALEENIIVYLGTGCGKTHIAVLLIYELGYLIRKPLKNICIFLAPTVALVHQQAKVIEQSIDFKVGIYCGNYNHYDWGKEIEQYEVLVMTPQILLHTLSHSFIKMEYISLLIFDECHHAQVQSGHPYAEIMRVFYKTNDGKLPRIFGMTASPVVGKGATNRANLPKSINNLENILDAKVYSVEDNGELERFVASPVVRIYSYGPVANGTASSFMIYCTKLEEIKRMCILELNKKTDHRQSLQGLRNTKQMLTRMHDNVVFCLENLGLWGALQACKILSSGDHSEWNALIEAEGNINDVSIFDRYLAQAAKIFAAVCTKDGVVFDVSCVEVLDEPFFSRKLLRFIGILSNCRLQPNMKCIVFVNRIITARSLSYILQNLKFLTSWKCDFLVGVHSGLKSVSRKATNNILEKFRTGKLNLLIATKVGEEGLDIQTCCLVIRFDMPETVASFIQSRGRARMPQSEYAFLVDSGKQRELDLIESFKSSEDRMNVEISLRTSNETFVSIEEKVYKVDASGASVSSAYSVSLLHHYCAKLPHDEYFDPKPRFFFIDDLGGTVCTIILPSNAPINQIVGAPQSSQENAKKDACLKAIEQLHKCGALSDFLLPHRKDADEELVLASSDPGNSEDESSRELHEMLVPSVLKKPWTGMENEINLHMYCIDFCPIPEDRIYKKFGLFVKAPLPLEAEKMELDLHLARGRYVRTKFVPSELSSFNSDEITQAMNFQEMFLKVILDRSKFVSEFVPLGKISFYESSPSFYLLLPVLLCDHGDGVTVDWETIRRCLSSPIFRGVELNCLASDDCLQLANGSRSISEIENSLAYIPHKKEFYFITNVIHGKNGYSPHKNSSTQCHMEHLIQVFGIQLKYPEQPLLQAKPLFNLHNLLHNRRKEDSAETQELPEYFIDVPPELCELKIIGFSKDMGSSISLLPSIMHRLENLLVAIELKSLFSTSFSEGNEVTVDRILEALTTERCQERFSLERLETLGDAFLKFAVGRHLFLLHDTLDEGELTRKRSNAVNNSNLLKLANRRNLQVYIRDQPFDPCQFFPPGHPCPIICTKESERSIHPPNPSHEEGEADMTEVRCSRGHHWLYKKTISDVVEALVGAFLVDSGFKAATAFLKWLGIRLDFEASEVIKVCQANNIFMQFASVNIDITALEDLLGHRFLNRGLLLQAFVHPSYNKHGGGCYQRLEFLGDAVLDYLITSYLFSALPKLKPGHLTDLRSALVNNGAFANVAVDRSFDKFLICESDSLLEAVKTYVKFVKTPASERNLLEGPKCPKVLGDLVESCMGAILLDTGFNLNCIWKLMLSFLDPILDSPGVLLNPFRELHELCQSHNWKLEFPTSKKGKTFLVEAKVDGKDICLAASASNSNKKEAIKIASEKIFVKLKDRGYVRKSNYLEKVLRSSQKMDAKLIGYDENPIEITVYDAADLKYLDIQEPSDCDFNPKILSMSKLSNTCSPSSVAANKQLPSPSVPVGKQTNETVAHPKSDAGMPTADGPSHRSAKQRLHEICAANCWKPPLFELCFEEGPSHMKSFTYKVIVEIEAPDTILESFGALRMKKKAAADHAAEGALWYLKNEGYLLSK